MRLKDSFVAGRMFQVRKKAAAPGPRRVATPTQKPISLRPAQKHSATGFFASLEQPYCERVHSQGDTSEATSAKRQRLDAAIAPKVGFTLCTSVAEKVGWPNEQNSKEIMKNYKGVLLKALAPGLLASLLPKMAHREKEAGRWTCPKCDEINKSARSRCNSCDHCQPQDLVANVDSTRTKDQCADPATAPQARSSRFGTSVAQELACPDEQDMYSDPPACTSRDSSFARESHQRRRGIVLLKIEQALIKHAPATHNTVDHCKLATQIENALHEVFTSDEKGYKDQARSVIFNLSDAQNLDFRSMLAIGFILPEDVPHLLPEQMSSYERTVRRASVRKESMEEVMQEKWDIKQGPAQVDGLLLCDNCSSARTTYAQLQHRRCDEPMTTYAMCLSCRKRWKF